MSRWVTPSALDRYWQTANQPHMSGSAAFGGIRWRNLQEVARFDPSTYYHDAVMLGSCCAKSRIRTNVSGGHCHAGLRPSCKPLDVGGRPDRCRSAGATPLWRPAERESIRSPYTTLAIRAFREVEEDLANRRKEAASDRPLVEPSILPLVRTPSQETDDDRVIRPILGSSPKASAGLWTIYQADHDGVIGEGLGVKFRGYFREILILPGTRSRGRPTRGCDKGVQFCHDDPLPPPCRNPACKMALRPHNVDLVNTFCSSPFAQSCSKLRSVAGHRRPPKRTRRSPLTQWRSPQGLPPSPEGRDRSAWARPRWSPPSFHRSDPRIVTTVALPCDPSQPLWLSPSRPNVPRVDSTPPFFDSKASAMSMIRTSAQTRFSSPPVLHNRPYFWE